MEQHLHRLATCQSLLKIKKEQATIKQRPRLHEARRDLCVVVNIVKMNTISKQGKEW